MLVVVSQAVISMSPSERSSPKPVKSPEEEEIVAGSPQENEFVSDTFQNDGHISDEDLKKEMQMLGMEDDLEKVEGEGFGGKLELHWLFLYAHLQISYKVVWCCLFVVSPCSFFTLLLSN